MADTTNNWGQIIAAIGASTIGIVSVLTQKPIPARQPGSVLDAAIGTDLGAQQQTNGLLMLGLLGGLFWLATRK